MAEKQLSRAQLLAAEIFGYSYANYLDHIGIGHVRFDKLMPQDAMTLEKAVVEEWPLSRVAKKLQVDADAAAKLLDATRDAIEVLNAEDPSEAFRRSVRQVVTQAIAEGFDEEGSIDALVTQICYRTADLAYLLKAEGTTLSRYSRHLRREADVEYHEGYFDQAE